MKSLLHRLPPALSILLLVALPHLIYVLSYWYKIPVFEGRHIGPTDPDPWLRLHLVREWLTSGDWYNHVVPHANTPFAEPVSPWARPLDVVIAALAKLQPASVDLSLRLMRAALFLPWLWMTLLLAGLFHILQRISPARVTYLMAAFFVAMMPIIWNYFGLANADHHAPLAVLFIWAIGGVLIPAPSRPRLVLSGILFGLMLWMSMEAAILIAIVYIWYGLKWLRGDHASAHRLATLATTIAFTSLVALMVEHPPAAWFTAIYDANSIVYVMLMTVTALFAWQLYFLTTRSLLKRIVYSAGSAAVFFGLFLFTLPEAAQGPMVHATPFVIHEFLPRITEVKALYHSDPLVIAASCVQPLIAFFLLYRARKSPQTSLLSPADAASLSYFSAVLFLLYFCQARWGYYAFPILALTIAPVLAALFEPGHQAFAGRWPASAMLKLSESAQASRRLPLVLLVVGLPLVLMLANALAEGSLGDAALHQIKQRRDYCYGAARVALRGGTLDEIHGKQSLSILAPTDLGTEILYFTGHRIVASNYHREGDAIQYVWDADKFTDAEGLRAHLAKRSIDAVLLCPAVEQPESSLLQGIANDSRSPPSWLVPYNLDLIAFEKAHADDTDKPEQALPKFFIVKYD